MSKRWRCVQLICDDPGDPGRVFSLGSIFHGSLFNSISAFFSLLLLFFFCFFLFDLQLMPWMVDSADKSWFISTLFSVVVAYIRGKCRLKCRNIINYISCHHLSPIYTWFLQWNIGRWCGIIYYVDFNSFNIKKSHFYHKITVNHYKFLL